jgi:acylphosphatase
VERERTAKTPKDRGGIEMSRGVVGVFRGSILSARGRRHDSYASRMSDVVRAHAWVSGRVQGVFYRGSTREEAVRLGLVGWVKNLADGRVELVAEGARAAVDALVAWTRHGPEGARVDDVRIVDEAPTGEFTAFDVLR